MEGPASVVAMKMKKIKHKMCSESSEVTPQAKRAAARATRANMISMWEKLAKELSVTDRRDRLGD